MKKFGKLVGSVVAVILSLTLSSYVYAVDCRGKVSSVQVDSSNSLLISASSPDGAFAYNNVRICNNESASCRSYFTMVATALAVNRPITISLSGGDGSNLCKIPAWSSPTDKSAWIVGISLSR